MGISMRVLMMTDGQIQDLDQDPSRLEDMLNGAELHAIEGHCHLTDSWGALHYVLTGGVGEGELPLGAVMKGDVDLSKGLADPAHAIYSATARALSRELLRLSEPTLQERFDPQKMFEARVSPHRGWAADCFSGIRFADLMQHFRRLQAFVAAAAEGGKGLVFYRFEDW